MKRVLSTVLAIIMVASAFLMSGCMKKENYYTRTDIDSFINDLKQEIETKNSDLTAKINDIKTEYDKSIAVLNAEIDANEKDIQALTEAYNQKVAELTLADKENANALAAHKQAYDTKVAELNSKINTNQTKISDLQAEMADKIADLKAEYQAEINSINTLIGELQAADLSNQAAIKTLTDAYNAKMKELEATDKANKENLQQLTDTYNAKVAELEGQLSELLNCHVHEYGEWESDSCEDTLYYRACLTCKEVVWKYDTAQEHTYGEEYLYNSDCHFKKCKNCEKPTEPDYHTFDETGFCTDCHAPMTPTEGITYQKSDDGTYATATGYTGASQIIRIADTYNGAPVTSIESSAFINCTGLTIIIITDSVTSIGDTAFYDCT
ncbi:MAG: leucine-rich repeat protein, partial [Clostridia bacterium]|nr:leucine-rich repeat protein [Clostridia bacterium]